MRGLFNMFKENKEFQEKLRKATIHVVIPDMWKETLKPYEFCPREVRVTFGGGTVLSAPLIFKCYFSLERKILNITHLKPSYDFSLTNGRIKGLVDAYLEKTLKEFIRQAELLSADSIVVESDVSLIANTFVDLNFKAEKKENGIYVGEYNLKKGFR
jgi:hypothetical protein